MKKYVSKGENLPGKEGGKPKNKKDVKASLRQQRRRELCHCGNWSPGARRDLWTVRRRRRRTHRHTYMESRS